MRDWLKALGKAERTEIGADIQSVQFGWPLGMPLVKHLQDDLWEVRTSRTQVRRLLDPDNTSITLTTLLRAADVAGHRLVIGFEPVTA